jgi:O-methyltransferase involved in polyketide biosynthesis
MKDPLKLSFDSISPSAKSLLLTKALTTIPFAREAAGLIWGDESIQSMQNRLSSMGFLMRLIHFEKRYCSIDKALKEIGVKNILEFSSGFSFRGLSMCKDPGISYIETDLAQIIENKKIIVQELIHRFCNYPTNNFSLVPLNIMDKDAFAEVVSQFITNPVAIINEGLLVYLDDGQKRKLCENIYNLLNKRGGYWITADIYIKKETEDEVIEDFYDEKGKKFIEDHQVEDNKFESFRSAEVFFKECGFNIHQKIEIPSRQLSSIKFVSKLPRDKLKEMKRRKRTRETWILKTTD